MQPQQQEGNQKGAEPKGPATAGDSSLNATSKQQVLKNGLQQAQEQAEQVQGQLEYQAEQLMDLQNQVHNAQLVSSHCRCFGYGQGQLYGLCACTLLALCLWGRCLVCTE